MTDELRRRLREVVDARYGGSAREASLALGNNPNLLHVILKNPNHVPELKTLATMARTFHWPLCDVVCWALGLSAEEPDLDPLAEVERGLTRMGVPPQQRRELCAVARSLASAYRDVAGTASDGGLPDEELQ